MRQTISSGVEADVVRLTDPKPSELNERFEGIDSVVFLMFPGWRQELRANRWHYARRWARQVPVTLVQPDQRRLRRSLAVEPEPRIDRCSILSVREQHLATRLEDSLVAAGQIVSHLKATGCTRPLLWTYNPLLCGVLSAVPAVARVYHATENYFDFPGLPEYFVRDLRATIRLCETVVAASDGVGSRIRGEVPNAVVQVVSNGCDARVYASASPDPEVVRAQNGFDGIATFAGNLNARLDYDLLLRTAETHAGMLFLLVGPVRELTAHDEAVWVRLAQRSNVRALGEVDADRLPSIYAASDVGLIPYKRERFLVENGFPLKALEMGAAGLPVVTTPLRPLEGFAGAIVVTDGSDSFVDAVGRTARKTLSETHRDELRVLCERNDYDEKFREVVAHLRALPLPDQPVTRLDELTAETGSEWSDGCVSIWQRRGRRIPAPDLRRQGRNAFVVGVGRIPKSIRSLVPRRLRSAIVERVLG